LQVRLSPVLGCAEIIRRCVWSFLRLENEHLHTYNHASNTAATAKTATTNASIAGAATAAAASLSPMAILPMSPEATKARIAKSSGSSGCSSSGCGVRSAHATTMANNEGATNKGDNDGEDESYDLEASPFLQSNNDHSNKSSSSSHSRNDQVTVSSVP
jgi:hypothetical protein